MNHYEVLGVDKNATLAQIKFAYKRLVKEHHTDHSHGGDHDKMTAITKAYGILRDPEKRARYDRTGQDERPDDIEVQAINMLSDGFSQYLDTGRGDEDPLHELRIGIEEARGRTNQAIAECQRSISRILSRAKKVKRKKPGHDIYAEVIKAKMQTLNNKIESAGHFLKLTDTALAILDDYECEPVQARRSTSMFFSGFDTGTGS